MPNLFIQTVFCLLVALNANARESMDYITEHGIESGMNARYHALPEIETSPIEALRLKVGYAHFQAGPTAANMIQLSGQKSFNIRDGKKSSIIVSAFWDYVHFDTASEQIEATILKNGSLETQDVEVALDEKTSAVHHLGIGGSYVHRFSQGLALQAGILGEVIKVSDFKVGFTTVNESSNYSGELDYNHTYYAYAPYLTLRWFHDKKPWGLNLSGRFELTYPMPRVDFQRKVTVGSNTLDLTGEGKHIPDGFAGIGYTLEDPKSLWRLDFGSTLSFSALEGVMHKGITNAFLINYSFLIR